MKITLRKTISMVTGEVLEHVWYEYEGAVDLACGASNEQKQIEKKQAGWFDTAMNQAQQIFGNSSAAFQDLMNTFAPTVAAGPNQQGFSAPEEAALKSKAITESGEAYRDASTAVKEANAAAGGGNMALPGGAEIGRNIQVANAAAKNTANELNQIEQANWATGRENYNRATAGLAEAPNVFNPSTGAGSSATSSGSSAAETANKISEANNSWISGVTGALGGIVGGIATGGMKNLGEGVGFFGQNRPPAAG